LSVAVSRIGGDAADIGHSLDIYMNLWQSRAFRIDGNVKILYFDLVCTTDGKHSAFFIEITAIHNDSPGKLELNPNAATILMLSARYLEVEESKKRGRLQ